MSTERLIVEWQDAAGGFLRAAGWLDSTATLATVASALQGVSNANLAYATEGVPYVSSVAPVAGATWWLTTDTMVLLFRCADGTTVQIVVPAPKQSNFLPDGLTVDPTAPDMVSLITAVVGEWTNNAGSLVTAFIQGVRSSRRTEQNTQG